MAGRRTRSTTSEDEVMTKRLKEEVLVPEEAIDDDKDGDLDESDAAAAVAAVAAAVQEKKDLDESAKAADVLRQTLENHVGGDHVSQNDQDNTNQNHVDGVNNHVDQEDSGHVGGAAQTGMHDVGATGHVVGQHSPEAQGHVHHGMTAINQHVPSHVSQQPQQQQHQQHPHPQQLQQQQSHPQQPVNQGYELDINVYNQQAMNAKPPVGSEQWHQMRRDNHKEVERRRRETINDGINTLAELIATSEKNKGQILKNAIDFIRQLKEQDEARTQKAAMDKFSLMNQVTETSAQNNRLKTELQRAWREAETWKGKYQELESKHKE